MPRPALRLSKQLRDAQQHPDPDVHLRLYSIHDGIIHGVTQLSSDGDLHTWVAQLKGPADTPFEGGTYKLLLKIPQDYPMLPPKALFITKVFHPNVQFNTGEVCLDILKTRWSPAWTLNAVCRAILNLLAQPEASNPFNCDAGNLIRAGDLEGYNSVVRMYAITEAGAPPFDDNVL